MADTSNFPKMGESLLSSVVNLSGKSSPYTETVAKKNHQAGEIPGSGDKKNRGSNVIRNAEGPAHKIVAKICYPNAQAEAGQTYRSVKRVRPSGGFYDERARQGNTGNV